MKLEILKNNKKISLEEIKILENSFNLKLPKEYKKFLLENDGGKPSSNLVLKPLHEVYKIIKIETFFSLEQVYNFLEVIKEARLSNETEYFSPYLKYSKNKMLIIAETYENLFICICFGDENIGKIYAVNHNYDVKFIFLSNNLKEFLNDFQLPYAHDFEAACELGDYEGAKAIFDKGIDLNLLTYNDYSILDLALKHKLFDIVEQIIKKQKPKGIIFSAMKSFNSEVLKFVLENGCNVNEINGLGQTALFKNNKYELIKVLIEFGINVNITDNKGKKAIDYCDPTISENLKRIFDLLNKAERNN